MKRRPAEFAAETLSSASGGQGSDRVATRRKAAPEKRPGRGPEAGGQDLLPGKEAHDLPVREVKRPAQDAGRHIGSALLSWYETHGRRLPWRETKDPYRIWVSEILLQQTRVDTAIPYYRRFLDRFPTVTDLARASLEEVLKTWENLGYYARARNLHRAAHLVVSRHDGQIPETADALRALPGIGPYVAGAIRSIAFGQSAPAMDANILRVMARLCAVASPLNGTAVRRDLERIAASWIPPEAPGAFHQALMDLGSLICTPRRPHCPECPLQAGCRAYAEGVTGEIPFRPRKPSVPHAQVVAAILRDRRGRWLVVRRPAKALLGGLWKFPGGFLRPGEDLVLGLIRCCREEIGMTVSAGPLLASVDHAYTHLRITLTAFTGDSGKETPRAGGRDPWRWVTADELDALPLSKADRLIARAVVCA